MIYIEFCMGTTILTMYSLQLRDDWTPNHLFTFSVHTTKTEVMGLVKVKHCDKQTMCKEVETEAHS